jgi:hypothetical protein
MLRFGVIIAVAGAALTACSSMNVQGDAPPDDRIFTTGSHLPTRAGMGTNSVKTLAQPTFDQVMRGQVCAGGGPCGAGN